MVIVWEARAAQMAPLARLMERPKSCNLYFAPFPQGIKILFPRKKARAPSTCCPLASRPVRRSLSGRGSNRRPAPSTCYPVCTLGIYRPIPIQGQSRSQSLLGAVYGVELSLLGPLPPKRQQKISLKRKKNNRYRLFLVCLQRNLIYILI